MTDVADDYVIAVCIVEREQSCSLFSCVAASETENRKMSLPGFVKHSATAAGLSRRHVKRFPEMLSIVRCCPERKFVWWIGDDPGDIRLQVRHALEPSARLQGSVEAAGRSPVGHDSSRVMAGRRRRQCAGT